MAEENSDDLYEVVVHYFEPQYQVIHLKAPSAEQAQQMILNETKGLGFKDFQFKSVQVLDNPELYLQ